MHKLQIHGVKIIILLLLLLPVTFRSTAGSGKTEKHAIPVNISSLYDELQLASCGLKCEVFQSALAGYQELLKNNKLPKTSILSIADLSQSSNNKRLYIINLESKKLVMNTYVAHGRNSGEEFATAFSNKAESYQSSLGFYITGETYKGKHGLSLALKGQEQGINDNAESRAIVIHGASYVSEDFIKKYGRLGRSQGCPAVSEELSEPLINMIKEGSCFFMYHP